MFGVSLHDGGVISDGGYVLKLLLKCCVQSVCIESVFHCEHYTELTISKKNRENLVARQSLQTPKENFVIPGVIQTRVLHPL